jgi:hypothetical protein
LRTAAVEIDSIDVWICRGRDRYIVYEHKGSVDLTGR